MRKSRRSGKFGVPALAGVMTLGAMALAGCNIVAPVAYAVHGPAKVQAQYKLDPARTTVVFIDDPASRVSHRRLRTTMAQSAQRLLLNKNVIADMVDARAALTVASKDRHGEQMSVQEIGEAVGADVVIWGVMNEFTLSADQVTYLPTANMQVRVYDVAQQRTVWPEGDDAWFPLTIQARQRPGVAPTGSDRSEGEIALAEQLGTALAQLFYKHEVTEDARR